MGAEVLHHTSFEVMSLCSSLINFVSLKVETCWMKNGQPV